MSSIKELIKDPETVIVDVRSPWEFDTGHITGAKNIPLEEVIYKAKELKALNKPIVLYCRSGNRSGMAVNILKQNGLVQVYNGGGIGDMQFLLN